MAPRVVIAGRPLLRPERVRHRPEKRKRPLSLSRDERSSRGATLVDPASHAGSAHPDGTWSPVTNALATDSGYPAPCIGGSPPGLVGRAVAPEPQRSIPAVRSRRLPPTVGSLGFATGVLLPVTGACSIARECSSRGARHATAHGTSWIAKGRRRVGRCSFYSCTSLGNSAQGSLRGSWFLPAVRASFGTSVGNVITYLAGHPAWY